MARGEQQFWRGKAPAAGQTPGRTQVKSEKWQELWQEEPKDARAGTQVPGSSESPLSTLTSSKTN